MQRLRSRQQFQAVLASAPVAKTPHFALHRLSLDAVEGESTLFAQPGPWLGVLVPKRWARRAVTRNAIRRQIYACAPDASVLPRAAHVVRLRSGFDKARFVSASSEALKHAVRAELLQLWLGAESRGPLGGTSHVA
ncbi:MAG: ribonuclease P protein component [Hydrogenophaga sp.]|uniref:ribonuclease P protein component n=1 Tax=Hydrogenophaga sp. TaxID=1904254 RepID=UPI001E0F9053|nr:ribonuclease P protein component [Hydrogenophaga sp.]MBX3608838.1 ribonuclease P protein component [Hydrogenophaga sp.]